MIMLLPRGHLGRRGAGKRASAVRVRLLQRCKALSITSVPKVEAAPRAQHIVLQRGLTIRSFMVTIFALLLMGMWVEYQDCYLTAQGSATFAENSPPNAAICVIIVLLLICTLLYRFRRSLGLVTAELIVVYSALLVAAPLMTQGMWHRFYGLLLSFEHNGDFKSYQSMPPNLWPHGVNLIENPRFDHKADPLYSFTFHDALNRQPATVAMTDLNGNCQLVIPTEEQKRLQDIEDKQAKELGRKYHKKTIPPITGLTRQCPLLTATDDPKSKTTLSIIIKRRDAHGHEQLIPGELYLFSCLLRADGMQATSSYFISTHADHQQPISVYTGTATTTPTYACPGGFQRVGACPLVIPADMQETYTIDVGLHGPGKIYLQDLQFFSIEATEGGLTGRKVVQQRHWGQLGPGERDFTAIKPDNMLEPGRFELPGARLYPTAAMAHAGPGLVDVDRSALPGVLRV